MQHKMGLRQQKKQHVLNTVHKTAVTLFTKRGYDTVSMEDIAKASGISRSTLFRHFATKEATVLHNNLDPILRDIFRNQPIHLTVIQAIRNTLHNGPLQSNASKLHEQRYNLIRTVPRLRIALLQELAQTSDMLIDLIAERANRSSDDIVVCTLANALMGIAVGIVLSLNETEDYLTRFDQALEQLEVGFVI